MLHSVPVRPGSPGVCMGLLREKLQSVTVKSVLVTNYSE